MVFLFHFQPFFSGFQQYHLLQIVLGSNFFEDSQWGLSKLLFWRKNIGPHRVFAAPIVAKWKPHLQTNIIHSQPGFEFILEDLWNVHGGINMSLKHTYNKDWVVGTFYQKHTLCRKTPGKNKDPDFLLFAPNGKKNMWKKPHSAQNLRLFESSKWGSIRFFLASPCPPKKKHCPTWVFEKPNSKYMMMYHCIVCTVWFDAYRYRHIVS